MKQLIKPLRDYDYCLVHIQKLEKRGDYTTLPFNKIWRNAIDKIRIGDQAVAHQKFLDCCHQIADSPDLTKKDAYNLQRAYTVYFYKKVEQYNKKHQLIPQRTASISRGGTDRGGLLTPRAEIQKTVDLATKAGVQDDVLKGLKDISKNWDEIADLDDRKGEFELTESILKEQIQAIAKLSKVENPDPKALAEAMTVAALTA